MHNTSTRMIRLKHIGLVALLSVAASVAAAAKDLAVVVNKSNDTKIISAADLSKLLKSTTRKWGNGQDVLVVMRDPSAPEMRVVLQKIYSMTPDQFRAFATSANQGHASPIFVFVDSDDVVLKMVSSSSAAIGLTDVYTINSSVAVLKVEGKMPLEPGYLLHGVW